MVRRAEFYTEIAQDLRFVARQLLRSPGFTVIVALTLALGIGATATVFSALNAVVLRPLDFEHSERIVNVQVTEKGERLSPTGKEFSAFSTGAGTEAGARVFSHVAAAILGTGFTITDGDVPTLVGGGRVSASYFDVFQAKPALGRVFTAQEDVRGRGNVVVLSYRAWASRYNGDSAVAGRTIHMNGESYQVIGVMPAAFDITRDGEELWVPLALSTEALAELDRAISGW